MPIFIQVTRPGRGSYLETAENARACIEEETTYPALKKLGPVKIEVVEMDQKEFDALDDFGGWEKSDLPPLKR